MAMNYKEALEYVSKAGNRGIRPGLLRIRSLLDRMGNPQNACRIIHVAGTNGKGSVCTIIAAALMEAGNTVGRYISPSVFGYREKIQKNGRWISEEDTASLVTEIAELTEKDKDKPTAFEIETAMAYAYFQRSGCDWAVVETGMGGRLDATNVIDRPALCVITDIAMDHMHFLGDTIEKIAGEKAGILMPGCPAVFFRGCPEAVRVLEETARKLDCPYVLADAENAVNIRRSLSEGQVFDYKEEKDLRTGLLGTYQISNAVTAVEALRMLGIPEDAMRRGLAGAVWPGRFDIVRKEPLLIEDGAHNPDGAQALAECIRIYLPGRKIILVMGVFADKEYKKMLTVMAGVSDTLITFRPDNARGLDARTLARAAQGKFRDIRAFKTQREAVRCALAMARGGAAVVHFGSLSTLAGLRSVTEGGLL